MPRIASRAPACQCQWLHTACQRQFPVGCTPRTILISISTLQPFGTERQSGRRQRIGPGGLLAAARTCAVAAGALLGSLLQLLKRDLCLLNAGCSRWQHGNAPARARGPGTRRAPPRWSVQRPGCQQLANASHAHAGGGGVPAPVVIQKTGRRAWAGATRGTGCGPSRRSAARWRRCCGAWLRW